jgi:hypothetical protein
MTGSAHALQNGAQMVVGSVDPMETVDPTTRPAMMKDALQLKTADLSRAP